ncbi:MAG: hypothetical protein BWY11_00705 [Firmicutes bacterium ADurb.Bin182]|nr:MAG: hypothetical protein BWY11_00705 [Firmicutes bacterium ADurb.Bin182]
MKDFRPVIIKPLKFRGIFGITWIIYKRGLFPMLVFTFLFTTVVMLALSILSFQSFDMLENIWDFGNFGNYRGLRALSSAAAAIPEDFSSAFRAMMSGFAISALSNIINLANFFVLQPMYQGSAYTEMSQRIYGKASSLSSLLRRSGFMLKRFFTTYLSHYVAMLGFGIAVAFVFIIMFVVVAFGAAFSIMTSGADAGLIIGLILLYFAFIAAMMTGPVLTAFVFPITVNENIKNFKAVGRSIKLVAKKFWRVFCANLIAGAVMFFTIAALIAAIAVYSTNYFSVLPDFGDIKLLTYIALGFQALLTLFLLPYFAALNTVLYFDTRVRTEGEGWLNYARATEPEKTPADSPGDSFEEGTAAFEDESALQPPRDYPEASGREDSNGE